MSVTIRVEEIMTARRLLQHGRTEAEAAAAAEEGGFDAVPLLSRTGSVQQFWNRAERRRMGITRRHRIAHDRSIEELLPALGSHVVQFVFYRSELVGLVDASDLNRPMARLAWLHPMLELERAILELARAEGISEERQAAALGGEATEARRRRQRARGHDVELPLLLEYSQFAPLLRAATELGLASNLIDDVLIRRLADLRNRAAHGAAEAVIRDRGDCESVAQLVALARRTTRALLGRHRGRE